MAASKPKIAKECMIAVDFDVLLWVVWKENKYPLKSGIGRASGAFLLRRSQRGLLLL